MIENSLIEKIDEICPDGGKKRHSYFQLQYFLIGKEPTHQAKLQACKRELLNRRDEIESYIYSLEELFDLKRIEQIHISNIRSNQTEKVPNEIEQIEIRKHERKIRVFDKKIQEAQDVIRAKENEANFLIGLYEKLINIEPEKDWDDLEVQMQYWDARLNREIESRLILGQTPSPEDIKTIMALPKNSQVKDTLQKLIEVKSTEAKKLTEALKKTE